MKPREQRYIEVLEASLKPGAVVQWKNGSDHRYWTPVESPRWNFGIILYRVLLPAKSATRRITKDDWEGQATVWVRAREGFSEWHVEKIGSEDFIVCNTAYRYKDHEWGEYSFTRKNNDWNPFEIQTPGALEVVATTEEEA